MDDKPRVVLSSEQTEQWWNTTPKPYSVLDHPSMIYFGLPHIKEAGNIGDLHPDFVTLLLKEATKHQLYGYSNAKHTARPIRFTLNTIEGEYWEGVVNVHVDNRKNDPVKLTGYYLHNTLTNKSYGYTEMYRYYLANLANEKGYSNETIAALVELLYFFSDKNFEPEDLADDLIDTVLSILLDDYTLLVHIDIHGNATHPTLSPTHIANIKPFVKAFHHGQ